MNIYYVRIYGKVNTELEINTFNSLYESLIFISDSKKSLPKNVSIEVTSTYSDSNSKLMGTEKSENCNHDDENETLCGLNLKDIEFHFSVDFSKITFRKCNFENVSFLNDMNDVLFSECNMSGASYSNCVLHNVKFMDCDMSNSEICFIECSSDICIHDCEISGSDFYFFGNINFLYDDMHPLMFPNNGWGMCYFEGYLRVGCQRHKIEDWLKFSYEEIYEMDTMSNTNLFFKDVVIPTIDFIKVLGV